MNATASKIEDALFATYDKHGWREFSSAWDALTKEEQAAHQSVYDGLLDYEAGGSHWSDTAAERAFGC